jgi:hypothetical protein
MGKIILKTRKLRTTIPKKLIRQAVLKAIAMDLSTLPKKTAAEIKPVAPPKQRKKHSSPYGKASKLR